METQSCEHNISKLAYFSIEIGKIELNNCD
jgi:hypothetical protein